MWETLGLLLATFKDLFSCFVDMLASPKMICESCEYLEKRNESGQAAGDDVGPQWSLHSKWSRWSVVILYQSSLYVY